MLLPNSSIVPLICEISAYLFVIYGFAGIVILVRKHNPTDNILPNIIFPGFILYLAFYTVMRWAQLPQHALIILLTSILIIGYILLIKHLYKNKSSLKPLILFAIFLNILNIFLYTLPHFIVGIDPKHYAIDMAWSMNFNWLLDYQNILGPGTESLYSNSLNFHRAALSGLGWLNNFSNISINLGTVQRHISFFTIFTIIQLFRLHSLKYNPTKKTQWLKMLPFIAIFLGAHYLASIASFGQINTAFAAFILISIVLEIIKLNQTNWKFYESWVLFLLAFILFTSYTEIIVMLPLFVLIAFLFPGKISFKKFLKTLIPLFLGILPIFLLHISMFWKYLFGQATIKLHNIPLGRDFIENPFNITANIIGNANSTNHGMIILAIVTTFFVSISVEIISKLLRKTTHNKTSILSKAMLFWAFTIYYCVLVYKVMIVTPDKNYVLFKMGSWSSLLIAIAIYIIWLYTNNTSKKKILKFLAMPIITYIVLVSVFYSGKKMLDIGYISLHREDSVQPPIHFVSQQKVLKLTEKDPSGQFLRDSTWVDNLAPWNNTPIIEEPNLEELPNS